MPVAGIGGIFMGWCLDRRGMGVPAMVGASMIGLGGILTSYASSPFELYLIYGGMLGFFGRSTLFAPLTANITRWFEHNRSFAVGVVGSGQGLAGMIWPQIFSPHDRVRRLAPDRVVLWPVCTGHDAAAGHDPASDTTGCAQTGRTERTGGTADETPAHVAAGLATDTFDSGDWLLRRHVPAAGAYRQPCERSRFRPGTRGRDPVPDARLLGAGQLLRRRISGQPLWRPACDLRFLNGPGSSALCAGVRRKPARGLYIAAAMFGLGYGGILPCYPVIVRELLPSAEAGRRTGLVLLFAGGGMALGSWLGGAVFDATGTYRTAFLIGVAFNAGNLAIIASLIARTPRFQRAYA